MTIEITEQIAAKVLKVVDAEIPAYVLTFGPRYFVRQYDEFNFAVLGPNTEPCGSYSGVHLRVCNTDGRDDAFMVARSLNAMNG